MRAVVTGGAGFIGSHIVDALIDVGAEVLVVDDLSRGTRANLDNALGRGARLVKLDVRDGLAVDEAFRSFQPELVFHLADIAAANLVRSCLDITRAQRDLRLPPPTPLSEGLARTLKALGDL